MDVRSLVYRKMAARVGSGSRRENFGYSLGIMQADPCLEGQSLTAWEESALGIPRRPWGLAEANNSKTTLRWMMILSCPTTKSTKKTTRMTSLSQSQRSTYSVSN